jgi:LEA14-like dessication related protein
MRSATPVWLAMALAGAACARFVFEQPTAQLVGVEVTGIGLQGGALSLQLDVHNPNTYDLTTARMALGLDLDGTHFGDVDLARDVVLPAGRTSRVELPLTFAWSGVGAGARALLGRGAVPYDLTGRLFLQTPIGERAVGVRVGGTVSLRDLVRS